MKRLDYSGAISNMRRGLLILGAAAFLAMLNPTISLAANTATAVQQAKVKVKGTVTDQTKSPVIGASVSIKGSTTGMMTDIDGKFSLDVPAGSNLTISGIGFKPQTVKVTQAATINIVLENDNVSLEQVVVVGYGTQRKSDITGSVASVKSEDIAKAQVINAAQAMQGRAAGVMVTSNDGSPGGSVAVRIRGIGTVNNADPLYVVDGFPIAGNVNYLSTNEIESIEVLKDASASAIYGARAANGVVLITTKKGKEGTAVINFQSYYGVQQAWKKPDLLNAEEWFSVMKKSYDKGVSVDPTAKPFVVLNGPKGDTDWFKEVTQTAPMQNYNISFNGGSSQTHYSVGADYFKQEGIVKESYFERVSFKSNADHIINKWLKIGENLTISNSNRTETPGGYYYGAINTALKMEPVVPVMSNGDYAPSMYSDWFNPVSLIKRNHGKNKEFRLVGNAFAMLTPIKGLDIKSSFGVDLARTDIYDFKEKYQMSAKEKNERSQIIRNYSKNDNWLWENTVSYHTVLADDHNVTLLAGVTAQANNYEDLGVSRYDVPGSSPELWYVSAATDNTPQVYGTGNEWSMASYLGRLNYSFKDKYLLTASVRRDGSSRFGPDNRYGTFPSASLAWKISNEDFFKRLDLNWISSLKVRSGWGQIGNDKISLYQYVTTIGTPLSYAYTFANKPAVGAAPTSIGNPAIKWEIAESTNFGLDASFFNSKLSLTAEYYIKDTKDMLVSVPIPDYVGMTNANGNGSIAPYANAGTVKNKGFEFEMNYKDSFGDFKYSVGGNISIMSNEVISLGGVGKTMAGGSFQLGTTTQTEKGHAIGEFFGYVTDGLFQTQDEVSSYVNNLGAKIQPNAIPGDFRFKDVNNDGAISDLDRTYIGSPIPDFMYAINISCDYKGVDLTMFFQGSQGNEIFNAVKYFNLDPAQPTNKSRDILKSWDGPGTSNTLPVLNSKDKNNNLRISDRYVEDGSYVRLKNLQIGYTLPKLLTAKAGVSNLRVYVSSQNLFTLTDYSGLDPEIGQSSEGAYLSRGVDYGFYPQAKTFSVGLNITF